MKRILDSPLGALLGGRGFHLAALLVMGIAFYANQLWVGGLPGNDDGTYAAGALDMLDSGDWLTPRFNGDPQFSTAPPGFYWLLMASFKIFGPTDFAARFAGAAATILAIFILFFVALRLSGSPDFAALAAAAFCLDPFVMRYGHHAVAHTAWAGAAALALGALYEARRRPACFLAFAVLSAVCILLKSALGCSTLAIGAAWLLWERAGRKEWLRFAGSACLALALGGAWFALEYRRFGEDFVREHFGDMLFHYAFRRMPDLRGPWIVHHVREVLRQAAASSMVLLPLTLASLWKDRSPQARLVIAWITVPIAMLAATTRFELRYMAPAFPGMALGLAYFLDRGLSGDAKRAVLASVYAASLAWALATLAFPIPRGRNYLAETGPLIQAVGAQVPPGKRWLLVVSPEAAIDPRWPNRMLTQHYELSGPVNRGVVQQVLFYTRRRFRAVHARDVAPGGAEDVVFGQDRYLPPGSLPFLKAILKGPDWTLYRLGKSASAASSSQRAVEELEARPPEDAAQQPAQG